MTWEQAYAYALLAARSLGVHYYVRGYRDSKGGWHYFPAGKSRL